MAALSAAPWQAAAATLVYCPVLYVLPLGLSRPGPRDDPAVISSRCRLAVASSALGCWLPAWLLGVPRGELLRALGLWPASPSATLLPAVPFALLNMIPALSAGIRGPVDAVEGLVRWRSAAPHAAARDLLWAPLSEELVFRASLLAGLKAAGVGDSTALLLSPLPFALAHLRRLRERLREGHPWFSAAVATLAQTAYTSIFALYASSAFLGTGSLWGCVTAHSLCNLFGVPNLGRAWSRRGWAGKALALAGVAAFFATLKTCTVRATAR